MDLRSGLYDLDRKTGTLLVLVYLYDHGTTAKTSISRLLGHRHETITGAINTVRQLGLILCERETWFPFRETFRLTALGKELVEAPLHQWSSLLRPTG